MLLLALNVSVFVGVMQRSPTVSRYAVEIMFRRNGEFKGQSLQYSGLSAVRSLFSYDNSLSKLVPSDATLGARRGLGLPVPKRRLTWAVASVSITEGYRTVERRAQSTEVVRSSSCAMCPDESRSSVRMPERQLH